uniref:Uncharacterized protein n=1 Tax=Caenorhabditis japonica TaxID=281687 RepID=A0A8R1IGD8_CAEJA
MRKHRNNSNGPTTRKCVTELKNAIVRIKCPALEGTRHRMDDLLSNIGDEKVSLERLRLAFDAALAIISS